MCFNNFRFTLLGVLVLLSFSLSASAFYELSGAPDEVNPLNARFLASGPAAAYFNPSLLIQVPEKDVHTFLKTSSTGSTVTLSYGRKKIHTILKEISMVPLTSKVEHLTFQELIKGEKVIGTVKLTLKNKEHVEGATKHLIYDVQYKATSEYLLEEVILDMEGKKIGDQITLADIPELNNEHIDLLSPLDSLVVEVKEIFIVEDEVAEEDAAVTSEPVVIGAEEKE
jgi:large subunit ribosomal protein L25